MDKEVISNKQMQLLIFSYCIGAYLLFSMGASVKQHAWISTILAILISIPILIMYGRIMNLYSGKNLFDIIEIVFGKVFGKVLNLIVVFDLLFLGAYILNDFIDFIKITALFNTPSFIPILCIGILSIWILNEGIQILSIWAKLLIRTVLFFLFLSWVVLIPEMEVVNLYPILNINFKDIVKEAIILVTFPFTELFIFLTFFDYIDYDKKTKNIFIKPLIIGGILIIISIIINLMLVGPESYSLFYYSGYEGIKRIKIQGEFQRIEMVVSILFAILQFLEVNFCFLGASKGITKIFNLKEYRNILIPVVFLELNFAFIMFNSLMEAIEFIKDFWALYGTLIHIIFPSIIFIGALIKKKYFKKLSI